MTNAELIKALRVEPFEVESIGLARIMNDASDALDAAEKRIARLEEEHNKTVTAIFGEEQLWWENRCKELEAQMPKRGEWIEKWRFKTDGTPFHKIGDMECSVCHGDMLGRYYSKYCPHCGALLRGENDEQADC